MKQNIKIIIAFILILISITLLFFILKRKSYLQVVFLDVGQGDSILITTITGKHVLIDGGKYLDLDANVAQHMKFFDRSIDVVIATHPDLDHIGGLATIFDRYDINIFLHSGLLAGVQAYQELTKRIITSDVHIVTAVSGQIINLDEYTTLEILAPVPNMKSLDPNDYSIVAKLTYLDTTVLFTGDAPIMVENELSLMYQDQLDSNILKLGHHGSQTSSSSLFLDTVNPEYAIVSAGCDNQFGHPHPDVVSRITKKSIELLSTCDLGDIVFESDGKEWYIKNKNYHYK